MAQVGRQLQRENRQAARMLKSAWRRPPEKTVRIRLRSGGWNRHGQKAVRPMASGGAAGTEPQKRTIHFRLDQRSSGSEAASHQRYIERTEAAIESFGTLADTHEDRVRWWKKVAERTDKKDGCITIKAEAPEALRREAAARALEWCEQGRIGIRNAKALDRLRERRWEDGKSVRITTACARGSGTGSARGSGGRGRRAEAQERPC